MGENMGDEKPATLRLLLLLFLLLLVLAHSWAGSWSEYFSIVASSSCRDEMILAVSASSLHWLLCASFRNSNSPRSRRTSPSLSDTASSSAAIRWRSAAPNAPISEMLSEIVWIVSRRSLF
jgi:hypothetical protein